MTDILDITGPFFFPWGNLALGLLLLVAGALLFFLVRKYLKSRRLLAQRPAPALKSHEEAFEALRSLLEKRWIEEGEFRKYYFQLSEIFRRYLSRRFDVAALDYTSEEIIAMLSRLDGVGSPHRKEAGLFLKIADLSKFAGFHPGGPSAKSDLERVRSFVEATLKQEESPS